MWEVYLGDISAVPVINVTIMWVVFLEGIYGSRTLYYKKVIYLTFPKYAIINVKIVYLPLLLRCDRNA